MPQNKNLVSRQWLLTHLKDSNLVLFDAGMAPIGSCEPYQVAVKIKGAQRFDFSHHIVDKTNPLPNTMPTAEHFTELMQEMGVNQSSTVVVYDDIGLYSAARAWWMFKVMGFERVFVLDGGLPAWQLDGGEVQHDYSVPETRGDFVAYYQPERLIDADTVYQSIDDTKTLLLDARAPSRFSGEQGEPRAGMRAGHIPNSKNLPFNALVHQGYLKSEAQLHEIFAQRVPKEVHALQFSCGSGVTACILALAAAQIGYTNLAVYDGSWSEWGADLHRPIELAQ